MAKWTFEPGHTAAGFTARHMMVTNVRGHFKDVHGSLVFDPEDPTKSSTEVTIDARKIWTGEPARDEHLRSADFLDVENFPEITFRGQQVTLVGEHDYQVTGDLTIRGVTRPAVLDVRYLGEWQTPWWEDGVNKGPKDPRRLRRHNHHQPAGLWRQLERHHGQRRHRRQQHRRDHD